MHILGGEHPGGGHLWPGSVAHTPFPESWSPNKILSAVTEVAINNPWIRQTGSAGSWLTKKGAPVRFKAEGVVDGVNIRVIIEPGGEGIITGFPLF